MHFARDAQAHAFGAWAAELATTHPRFTAQHWYNDSFPGLTPQDRVSTALAGVGLLPDDETEVYLVGPPGFMRSVHQALRTAGFAAGALHYEAFGPFVEL